MAGPVGLDIEVVGSWQLAEKEHRSCYGCQTQIPGKAIPRAGFEA
jgi:hypothetical protein